MRIEVLKNFGGVLTNEKRILPGVYDSSDPRLFGVADYLVEHGHARVVEDSIPVTDFSYIPPIDDSEFHNDVMLKKGRPTIDEVIPEPDIYRDALLVEYEALTGKSPSASIKTTTLEKRISDLKSDS